MSHGSLAATLKDRTFNKHVIIEDVLRNVRIGLHTYRNKSKWEISIEGPMNSINVS